VGQVYITTGLDLPAHNARRDAEGLVSVVRRALDAWTEKMENPEKMGQEFASPVLLAR
jgi:hypothetical protein